MSESSRATLKSLHARTVRMQALVDMAIALPKGDPGLPGEDEATDSEDKLIALHHALRAELESMHAEVSHE